MELSVARQNMVESQLRPNGVTSPRLISAFGQVGRENFTGKNSTGVAYLDDDRPVGNGRFLLQPMVLGRLLQLAEIKPDDLVLDIGPATGYSSAIIAQLAESVVGLEQDKELCQLASDTLMQMGVTNAAIVCGQHNAGIASEAPFDVIVINGQISQTPRALTDQLSNGGRLVGVIGPKNQGKATVILKKDQKLSSSAAFDASARFLTGFEPAETGFEF